uniref:Uncharacterized protein n=1 Tax=Branchiostoma floridae TaxID=7739 RepID=C3Z053_BRAFL|eukprot:XP_002598100.1 hypothetical protein BRAFLDRAFT_124291 [Branchiostoma floridae]
MTAFKETTTSSKMGRSKINRVKQSASANLDKLLSRIRELRNRLFRRKNKKQLTGNDEPRVDTETAHLKETVETLRQDLEAARDQLGYQTLKTATIAEDRDIILRHQAVCFAAERAKYEELLAELGTRLSLTVTMETEIQLLQKRVQELERGQTLGLLKMFEKTKTSDEEKTAQPKGDAKDAGRLPWDDVIRPKVIKSGTVILQEARERVANGSPPTTDVRKARSYPGGSCNLTWTASEGDTEQPDAPVKPADRTMDHVLV